MEFRFRHSAVLLLYLRPIYLLLQALLRFVPSGIGAVLFLFQFTGFSIAHDIDDRVDDMASEWFGKFHVKAYTLIFRPAFGLFPPDYFGIAERGELHIDVFLSL